MNINGSFESLNFQGKLMKTSILLIMILFLSSCASTIDTYNPSNIPVKNLSTVSTEDVGLWIGDYEILTSIVSAFDSQGVKVLSTNEWDRVPEKVSLIHGDYQFVIRCETRNVYNFHHINVTINENEKYQAYCLGQYEDFFLGDRVTKIFGFISKEDELETKKVENQELVDRIKDKTDN